MLRTRDVLLTQRAVVSSMTLCAQQWGSRGSGLVLDSAGVACEGLRDYRYRPPQEVGMDQQVVTEWNTDGISSSFAPVRPIPVRDSWFENVWREYRTRTAGLQ